MFATVLAYLDEMDNQSGFTFLKGFASTQPNTTNNQLTQFIYAYPKYYLEIQLIFVNKFSFLYFVLSFCLPMAKINTKLINNTLGNKLK